MTKYGWAYIPALEIIVSLVFLALAAPVWQASGVLYWPPGPTQTVVAAFLVFSPFLSLPLFALGLLTLSARPQWTRGTKSARLFRNILLLLICLAVFPLLWWNAWFPSPFWLFGWLSLVLFASSLVLIGVVWLVLGALTNVAVTIVGHRLGHRSGRSSKRKGSSYDWLRWGFSFLVLIGPVLAFLPTGITVTARVYAVYLGALVPAMWPHFLLNRRR